MDWLQARDVKLPLSLTESYVKGESGHAPLNVTLGDSLVKAAKAKPDHTAFIYQENDTHITYHQLLTQVDEMAKGLMALGVKKGDVVMVTGNHGTEFTTLFYAVVSIGAVFDQPYVYEPFEMSLKKLINKVNVRLLILNEKDNNHIKAFNEVAPEFSTEPNSIAALETSPDNVPSLKTVVTHVTQTNNNEYGLASLLNGSAITDKQLKERKDSVGPDDPCIIFMSTGTTGDPKAMLHRHRSLANTPHIWQLRRNMDHKPCILVVEYPMFDEILSIFGLTSAVVNWEHSDMSCVITAENAAAPGASSTVVDAMERYRCTHADLWPYMWMDIIRHGTAKHHDLSSLRGGMSGAQILGRETVDAFTSLVPEFVNQYGTTETLTITSNYIDDPDSNRRLLSVGTPLANVEMKITDDDGKILPVGEIGEVYVRTPNMFIEYIGEPEKTSRVKDNQGWYKTGDMAKFDEHGFVYFVGRQEDNIRFKKMTDIVYPGVIEAAATSNPKIAAAQCVGIQNTEHCLGDDICLCVILKPGETMTEQEMEEHCTANLISKDHPDYYFFMDSLPKVGARQKVSKIKLREICKELIQSTSKP